MLEDGVKFFIKVDVSSVILVSPEVLGVSTKVCSIFGGEVVSGSDVDRVTFCPSEVPTPTLLIDSSDDGFRLFVGATRTFSFLRVFDRARCF